MYVNMYVCMYMSAGIYLQTISAYVFTQNQMTTLFTVNDIEGSHQQLVKSNVTIPIIHHGRRTSMPLVKQRVTHDDDINIAQPSVLHPPYQSQPDDVNIIQGSCITPNQ